MPDYSKTIVYMIKHKNDIDNTEVYIGHTTCFDKRRQQHKQGCISETNHHYKQLSYVWMREKGWENLQMIEVEKYPCNNLTEATNRERFWVQYYNAINERMPGRNQSMYRYEFKDYLNKKKKEYYNSNKSRMLIKQKQNYEKNKADILSRNKLYRDNHKEVISERQSQQITCNCCGSILCRRHLARHKRSEKCQNIVNNICRDVLYEIIDKI